VLVLLGIIGAALLCGDGIITPAISVLSAMDGLKLVTPAFEHLIVPFTLAILIGLFALQRRGTGSIGRLFGPIMVVWFVAIGALGVVNITAKPEILWALNPLEAVRLLSQSPLVSFAIIGAVFLALTGGEALYADMGHVGAAAIRRAWFGVVLPALLLNYFGQGALVLTDPATRRQPVLQAGSGVGACCHGPARDAGDHHCLASAHIGRVLVGPAGDAARAVVRAPGSCRRRATKPARFTCRRRTGS